MKVNNEEIEKNRWKDFDEKIDSLKEHPKYEWLRKYANDAKSFYDSFGYYQIKAEDFVERIKAATVEQIREWLVQRGVVIGFTPVYVKIENIVTGTISNKSSKFMVKIFN